MPGKTSKESLTNFSPHHIWSPVLDSSFVWTFATRAQLKGPKRSFLAVITVLLGVETWAKNVPKGTKNVHQQNLFQANNNCYKTKKTLFAIENREKWTNSATEWQKVINHGFFIVAFHGIVWPTWPFIVLYGFLSLLWQNISRS